MTTHGPVMPVWSCGGCDLPWPCPTRKRELRAEYEDAPVSLALYLGAYLVQATEDMPWTPAGVLHCRFLGWTRAADQPMPAVQQRCTATGPAEPSRAARDQPV
ncbi:MULTISPECIES: hypothetical protein [Micromonospora]|uniref:hypothetical protein n=1 Tax=Micromonospora TaxID=1873 RepID=UPI00064C3015|nr:MULTISPECIES: hypothetical protein [Micromonospora]MDG4750320.1 hypothetical protein [Micromonospora sp. WMMD718]OHX03409.1 hypothetical protein BFV98_10590 [Micromonospora sp. WMMB235]RNI06117.1 hypothetical protein EEZ25_02895 [Micromonospora aurantiaca]